MPGGEPCLAAILTMCVHGGLLAPLAVNTTSFGVINRTPLTLLALSWCKSLPRGWGRQWEMLCARQGMGMLMAPWLWEGGVGHGHGPHLPGGMCGQLSWSRMVGKCLPRWRGQHAEQQQDLGPRSAVTNSRACAGGPVPLCVPSPSPWAAGCCQLPSWGLPSPGVCPQEAGAGKAGCAEGLMPVFSLALGREEEAEGLRR